VLEVGAVYVYTKVGGTWTLQQKLDGVSTVNHPEYGTSLALEGDVLVTGGGLAWSVSSYGPPFDPPWLKGGAIGWTRSAGVWTSHIFPTAAVDFDTNFGMGIALDAAGGKAAVSEPKRTVSGFLRAGVVHIYSWDGTNWVWDQMVAPLDPQTDGYFGADNQGYGVGNMAIRGDYLFVGMPYDSVSGRGWVYVFKYSGGTWAQVDKFHAALANDGYDLFGNGVCAPDDSTLVVGAPSWKSVYTSQTFVGYQGAAWVFRTDAGWEVDHNHETMITRNPPALMETGMGYSVSMDSRRQILLGKLYSGGVQLLDEAMIPTTVPEPPVGYLMQAADSVTGLLHYWPTNARDMAAVGYPGPNAAVDVAVSGIVEDISLDPMLGNDAYLMQARDLAYPYTNPTRFWTSRFKDWTGIGWPILTYNTLYHYAISGFVHRIRR
jgi:hypothetical protein